MRRIRRGQSWAGQLTDPTIAALDADGDESSSRVLTSEQREMVEDHMGLVRWGATKFGHLCPDLDVESVYSACQLGLCDAAMRYDPSRGAFSTYASYWMKKKIQEEGAKMRSLPVPSRYLTTQKLKASEKTQERIKAIRDMSRSSSESLNSIGSFHIHDLDVNDEAEFYLSFLSEQQQRVVMAHLGGEFFHDIAVREGIHCNTVQKINVRAFAKMRKMAAVQDSRMQ